MLFAAGAVVMCRGGGRDTSPSASSPSAEPRHLEASPSTVDRGNARSALGTNLYAVSDFTAEWPFIDAFKTSREWIGGSSSVWEDGRPLDLDEHGWVRSLGPDQIARTLLFWDVGSVYPAGDYVLLYEGEGVLDYEFGARLKEKRAGRHVVEVDPTKGGVSIMIREVRPGNHLRNLRLLMPGGMCSEAPRAPSPEEPKPAEADGAAPCAPPACPPRHCTSDEGCAGRCVPFEESYAEAIFHPDFVAGLRPFGVIRFMDWMRTNETDIRRWEERPRLEDARWTKKGVPLEVMLALANRLGADPWFTIPHSANDDYVERFARAVRAGLASGRTTYVEHSNEVWNSIFPQAAYAAEQGRRRALSRNRFEGQLRYHALRSREIFDIFERLFGGTEDLVRVLGTHVANTWSSETMLKVNGVREKVDALAIAPYFGGALGDPEELDRVRQMSPDAVIQELLETGVPQAGVWVREHAAFARQAGVRLIAYEGGQHLVGVGPAVADEALNRLFDAVNRDPRMKQLYLDYLRAWREGGGDLFVHYAHCVKSSQWGRWGALEYLGQPREEAPKFDALLEFIDTNPRWWD